MSIAPEKSGHLRALLNQLAEESGVTSTVFDRFFQGQGEGHARASWFVPILRTLGSIHVYDRSTSSSSTRKITTSTITIP